MIALTLDLALALAPALNPSPKPQPEPLHAWDSSALRRPSEKEFTWGRCEGDVGEIRGRCRGDIRESTFSISASSSAMKSSSVGPGDTGEMHGRCAGDIGEITSRSAMKSSLAGPRIRGRG